MIKQKQLKEGYHFNTYLWNKPVEADFADLVLTGKEVDDMWQDYLDHRSATEDLFTNNAYGSRGNGKLLIQVTDAEENRKQFIKNILLFRKDDPDFLRVYKGSSTNLGNLRPGEYNVFLLLKGDDYFILDSVQVRPNGINFYETGIMHPKKRDSVSTKIWEIISNRERNGQVNAIDFDLIKESYHQTYLDSSVFTASIIGTIRDSDGKPVKGATVTIKGTKVGTASDQAGRFRIMAPSNVTIVVSSVGYESKQVRLSEGGINDLVLASQSSLMQEVVITGFGQSRSKSKMGMSVTVSGSGVPGTAPGMIARGTKSVNESNHPLYIVDGIPVDAGSIMNIDQLDISRMDVLRDEAATAIYGSRASGGVIIITTKKGSVANALQEDPRNERNSLRNNFRDDAYWQPRLKTDANGRASFEVTFPDDITNWRSFMIAANDKKQTGFLEGSIKSFKTISVNLGLPQFIVEGDTMNVVGKVLNYSADSISVKRTFSVNDKLVQQNTFGFRHSRIDTFGVIASKEDSLKLKYTIEKDNGYFDGEERNLPVLKQGVKETSGIFAALTGDTTVQLKWKNSARIKIYAESSLLNVLEKEAEKVRNYEYLCNEQLASKLKAWLVQRTIDSVLKRPFRGSKNIRELISQLNQNNADGGLWGWWKNNEPALWISLHVLEAMATAEAAGFHSGVSKTIMTDYLVYNMEKYQGREKIDALGILSKLQAKVDYKKYIDTIEKYSHRLSMYEKLKLAELKLSNGMKIEMDSLKKVKKETMFGNPYWGDDGYHFFDNSIQNTLLVYRLLKATGEDGVQLQKIRNYFLEKKRDGNWRSTYESSLILETILPDLLVTDSLPQSSTLTIWGEQPILVTHFPFATEISGAESLSVSSHGSLPVYFTAYEEHWNPAPVKEEKDFMVRSAFEKNGVTVEKLKGGEPVTLKVDVSVKKDADYVMIEIPVPAGCSYKGKSQPNTNNEVHREYFKNKVSIFCSSLKAGDYSFTVSLLPRYSGTYSLNPAKAELMYFPVFFGREAFKKISIQ